MGMRRQLYLEDGTEARMVRWDLDLNGRRRKEGGNSSLSAEGENWVEVLETPSPIFCALMKDQQLLLQDL